jgi:hypothetical protein
MQTPAFLWYELEGAKRHVQEALNEPQLLNKADLPDQVEAPARTIESVVAEDLYQNKVHLICRQQNC